MADVNLKSIRKTYDKTEVVHGVDLDINSGEIMVLRERSLLVVR